MLALLLLPAGSAAQNDKQLDRETVEARLNLVTTQSDLAPEVVEAASANYRAALERLAAADEARRKTRSLTLAAEEAPQKLEALESERRDIADALSRVEDRLEDMPAEEAGDALIRYNAMQLTLRERKDALERELAGRLTRPARLRDDLASLAERERTIEEQIAALAGATAAEPAQSELTLLQARQIALEAERERVQTALATLAERLEVADAELALVNARRALNERRITLLAARVAQARASESARATRMADTLRVQAGRLPSPLDEDVAEVAELYQELARTLTAIRSLSDEVTEDRAARERLAQDFEAIRSRVNVAGARAALGQLLRSQRVRVPDVRELKRELVTLREASASAGLRNLELVDMRRAHDAWIAAAEQHVAAVIAETEAAASPPAGGAPVPPGGPAQGDASTPAPAPQDTGSAASGAASGAGTGAAGAAPDAGAQQPADGPGTSSPAKRTLIRDTQALVAVVGEAGERRREVLATLARNYEQYVTLLADAAFEKRSLQELAAEYGAYLDDRLLWVPSSEPIGLEHLVAVPDALAWLTSPPHWQLGLEVIGHDLRDNAAWYLAGLLVLVVGFRIRRTLFRALTGIGQRTRKVRTDRWSLTLEALLYTAFIAALLPAAFVALGLRWQTLPLPEQVRAVAQVLPLVGYTIAAAGFIRLLCLPDGVGALHLHWTEKRRSLFPKAFLILQFVWLPLHIFTRVADAQSDPAIMAGLGRLSFVASCIVTAWVLAILLDPRRGLPSRSLAEKPSSWVARLQRVWFPVIVITPFYLAVQALAGYDYAALLLAVCLAQTALLLIGGMLLFDLLERWLRVTRRRYRYEQLLERRAAASSEGHAAVEYRGEGMPISAERDAGGEPDDIDIEDFDDQTRSLLSTVVTILLLFGALFIWSKALPILGVLDRLELWQYATMQNGAEVRSAVTVADALVALVTVFLVLLATRNLPSLLEFAVLKNLPLDAGSRYAIRTVTQYLLVLIGGLTVTSQLGLAWNQVQWLVAALSVGLGFGLQEIFANFVSGLIILLERPVRVGDTVTVGGISGSVTRIRIRATTITDWDNKEVIVPNKTFITGQLVNWTLSSEVTRVVVPIGIAYGSDTELAVATMMEVASTSPLVLKDPPPRVLFKAFGESSLDFEIFIYCRVLGERLTARHEVLVAMEKALRERGIQIPFPQRDVHIHQHGTTPARSAADSAGGVVETAAQAGATPRGEATRERPAAERSEAERPTAERRG